MQLTKLEIKGFKSFGDKIIINFNQGVTAIVGPNGCGKSNVVDAIRWVLGEQSTRTLRSEKMENIIFNGTKNRKPANLAEVSLTFDNTKNILPTEFSSVTITRKLFRTGESEYRLNDVKCRLKDITDLFLDTGIGADTYSIIELKMIDEIIANKDNSRRVLFEEASGISKYKVRKKQTLSKLKDTESDLSRVDDLLYEINKNLKSLENQAKKAEKYFVLKQDYKQASIHLAYYKLEGFHADLQKINQHQQEQFEKLQFTQSELLKNESELQVQKQAVLVKEKNLGVQQHKAHEFTNALHAYESDKKLKNTQLSHLQDKESRLITEIEADSKEQNQLQQNIKRLQEELFIAEKIATDSQQDLSLNQDELEELKRQHRASKMNMDAFVQQQNGIHNEIFKLEKDLAVLDIQKNSLENEAQRTDTETSDKVTELTLFTNQVSELQLNIDSQKQALQEALAQESEIQLQIQQLQLKVKQITEDLSKEIRLVDAKQNEYNLTKSLVDNFEGFPESIKFLRKNAGWAKNPPLFSDILFCQEDYRVAIENYLESVMNHYVVDSKSDAVQAIQLLSDSSRGRANFFVLQAIEKGPDQSPIHQQDERLISALDIISIEEKYKPLCQHLLNDVYLLKADQDMPLDADLPYDNITLLQSEGRYAKNKLGLSGGSVGLFEGKRIGRAKNLQILQQEIKKLNSQIEGYQLTIKQYNEQVTLLEASSKKDMLGEYRLDLNRMENELITTKSKLEQYQVFLHQNQNRKEELATKLQAIQTNLQTIEPELARLKNISENNRSKLLGIEESFLVLNEELVEKSSLYNQQNLQFHQQQNKVATLSRDVEYRESQIDNLEIRIARNTLEQANINTELKDASNFVDTNDQNLEAMYAQKKLLDHGVNELEKDFFSTRKIISDLETNSQQLRQNKDNCDVLITELKDKKTTLQIELNSLKERLSAEFNISLEDLLANDIPINRPAIAEVEIKCRKLKKQLEDFGSINSMAKETYDEMSARLTFIQKEKMDLLDAKSSLMTTINEIDQSANDKFMYAFTRVRENFIEVFRSLFNQEDACDIILTTPNNPLESDIDIIAQPKGKRPLSINQLSGGEKTLTSTALLFSLYLLKPAPFCIFDEVDAPLDDTNIDKFNNIIREFSNQSQFIVVSHNKRTIASTDIIYGVTMVEQGISRVVAVDIRDVA